MAKRIIVGILLILVLLATVHFGGWLQCALFTFGAIMSVFELGRALEKKGNKLFLVPAYAFAGGYYLIFRLLGGWYVLLLAAAAIMATITERIFNEKRHTEATVYSLFLFVYPLSFYAILMCTMELEGDNLNRIALFSMFAMPLAGDMMAYFIGKAFGKRKLCPALSPNKTVAGSVAGVFGGVLGGFIAYLLQGIYPAGISAATLLILGALLGAAGQVGDLFASAIKRWTEIKDFGKIFPGHGGVTDRLDSVLFCAPLAYLCFSLTGV